MARRDTHSNMHGNIDSDIDFNEVVAARLSDGWPVWRIAKDYGITPAEVRARLVEAVTSGAATGPIFGC